LRCLTVHAIVRAVEPSAVAARRTRASLALAVGGAIVLMAGVALILTGEAMKLEHPAHSRPLILPGLILVVLGFALGMSAAVTILLDAPTRLPSAAPAAERPAAEHTFAERPFAEHAPGDLPPADPAPGGPARYAEVVPGEVLSSFRLPESPYQGGRPGTAPPGPAAPTEVVPGAALSPPGHAGRVPAAAPSAEAPSAGRPLDGVPAAREPAAAEVPPSLWFHPGQPGPGGPHGSGWASEQPGDEVPGYADAGWDAGAASSSWPDPPAEPPHEIHHPVRR
jgi:hypothetical protein